MTNDGFRSVISSCKIVEVVSLGVENDLLFDFHDHISVSRGIKFELEFRCSLHSSLFLDLRYPGISSFDFNSDVPQSFVDALPPRLFRFYFSKYLDHELNYDSLGNTTEEGSSYDSTPHNGPNYDLFEIQSEIVDYKEGCTQTYRNRNKRGKKKVKYILDKVKELRKGEVKKLVAALSKASIQANTEFEPPDGLSFESHPWLKSIFEVSPEGARVFFEFMRLSTGLYVSTTRAQVIHHLMFSASAIAMSQVDKVSAQLKGLFMIPQAGESSFGAKFVSTLQGWVDNDILKDVKKAVIILLSLAFVTMPYFKDHVPDVSWLIGQKELMSFDAIDILHYAMKGFLFIFNRIRLVIETKSLSSFFTPQPKLLGLSERFDKLVFEHPRAMAGDFDTTSSTNLSDHSSKLHLLCSDVDVLLKTCSISDRVLVMRWKTTAYAMFYEVEASFAQRSTRCVPYSICLSGASGVGKTVLIPLLGYASGRAMNESFGEKDFFYRNAADPYWSGYHGQKVLVEDEKNAIKPDQSDVNENKVTLDVVNNSIMQLPMADLASKGVFTMRSLVYITTTNQPDWQAHLTCNEPVAVLRRSIHIVVEVKPEMRVAGSDMLDVSKCAFNPIKDDAWLFTVLEAISVPSKNLNNASGWRWIIRSDRSGRPLNKIDLHDLLKFIGDSTKEHVDRQGKLMSSFQSLFNVDLCPHGSGSDICRDCHPELKQPVYNRSVVDLGHPIINEDLVKRYRVSVEPTLLVDLSTTDPLEIQSGIIIVQCAIMFMVLERFRNWMSNTALGRVCRYSLHTAGLTFVLALASCFPGFGRHRFDTVGSYSLRSVYNRSDAVRRQPVLVQIVILLLSYCSLSWVWFALFGLRAASVFVLFDLGTAWINRSVNIFYRRLDRLGAVAGLRWWSEMRTRPFFQHRAKYLAITGAVASAMVIYKMLRSRDYAKPELAEQGNMQSEWNHGYTPPEQVSIQRCTTTSDALVTSLQRRVAHFSFYNEERPTEHLCCGAVPVKSGVWLVPSHSMRKLETMESRGFTHISIVFNDSAIGARLTAIPINYEAVWFFPGQDLALIHVVPTAGHMRDMTPYFTDKHTDCAATYISRNKDGTLQLNGENLVRMKLTRIDRTLVDEAYACNAPFPTYVGLCGAVQVSSTKNPSIRSIHVLGLSGDTESACIPIYKRDVEEGLKAIFSCRMIFQTANCDELDIRDGKDDKDIFPVPHFKSPMNFIDQGSLIYHGSVSERSKPCGTIQPTMMAKEVERIFGVKNKFGNPTALRSWRPWYKALSVLKEPHYKNVCDLRKAKMDYEGELFAEIAPNGEFPRLSPLDSVTTTSGIDGNDFYKHIVTKSSSGWPYKVPKSNFIIPEHHPDDEMHNWHFNVAGEWMQRVEDARERCRAEKRPNFVYSANLKVEAKRTFDVCDDGGLTPREALPRVFYGAPFEMVYLMRQYFMPIFDLIQEAESSEIAVGIVVTSPDWTELAGKLLAKSNNIMPADAQKFDQSITFDELQVVFSISLELASLCGYSPDDLVIMRSLATSAIYAIIEFDTDILSFFTLGASGGFGTVQINSMVNALRHRMYYYSKLFRESLPPDVSQLVASKRFRQLVFAAFFGDDSLGATDPRISDHYNLIGYSQYMAAQGVTITTEKKGDITVGSVPITECDFLKRSFRFDAELGLWQAPLNEDSIMKRLFVLDPSKVLTLKEQCGEAIASSLRDYFQYGREVFEDRREKLMELAEVCELREYVAGGFHGYDYFISENLAKYEQRLEDLVSVRPPAAMRG